MKQYGIYYKNNGHGRSLIGFIMAASLNQAYLMTQGGHNNRTWVHRSSMVDDVFFDVEQYYILSSVQPNVFTIIDKEDVNIVATKQEEQQYHLMIHVCDMNLFLVSDEHKKEMPDCNVKHVFTGTFIECLYKLTMFKRSVDTGFVIAIGIEDKYMDEVNKIAGNRQSTMN